MEKPGIWEAELVILSPDNAACLRKNFKLWCNPKGLGNDFFLEHDCKNVGKYPDVPEAFWFWLQTLFLWGLSAHLFPNGMTSCLLGPVFCPSCFLHTHQERWCRKENSFALALRFPPITFQTGECEGSSKKWEETWVSENFSLFRFLNFYLLAYDIFLPQSISAGALFHRLTFHFLFLISWNTSVIERII